MTWKAAASCWFASTSTFASSTLPARAAAARSSTGVSCLHGPHHSAQKSTTTGTSLERSSTCDSKVASVDVVDRASQSPRMLAFSMTTGLQRRAGAAAGGIAEPADLLRHVETADDLAEHGVIGRQARVGPRDDVELAAGRARRLGLGLRHGHRALQVGRIRRRLVSRAVAGAAHAAAGRVAALDDEVGDDPVEHGAVVEARAREPRHRRRGARRGALVEADVDLPAARVEDQVVALVRVELRRRTGRAAVLAGGRLLHVRAAAGRLGLRLGRRRGGRVLGVVVAAGDRHERQDAEGRQEQARHRP